MIKDKNDQFTAEQSSVTADGHPRRRASDFEDSMLTNFFNYALSVGKGATGLLSFGALYPWKHKQTSLQFAFSDDEVRSLIRYASEEGINPELVADTYKKLRIFEKHCNDSADIEALDKARVSLLKTYTELCNATRNINGHVTGRTVRDSMELAKHTGRLVIITFSFLVWGLLSEALGVYFAKNPVQVSAAAKYIWFFYEYGLRILNPFFWGGLGACVYVLKRSYDAARVHAFDMETFGGWGIRVVLGFVLGGAVLYVINPTTIGTGISDVVIAFLTGLSTKIVYGALEKLIMEISNRFQLDSTQPASHRAGVINEFLAERLSKVDPQKDREKYQVLVDLLKERGTESTSK